jgi:hypothetical protein
MVCMVEDLDMLPILWEAAPGCLHESWTFGGFGSQPHGMGAELDPRGYCGVSGCRYGVFLGTGGQMHARFGWNGKTSGELGHLRRESVDPFHVGCVAGNGTPLGRPQPMFLIFESGRSENPSILALGSRLRVIMDKGDMTTIAAFPTSLQEDTT